MQWVTTSSRATAAALISSSSSTDQQQANFAGPPLHTRKPSIIFLTYRGIAAASAASFCTVACSSSTRAVAAVGAHVRAAPAAPFRHHQEASILQPALHPGQEHRHGAQPSAATSPAQAGRDGTRQPAGAGCGRDGGPGQLAAANAAAADASPARDRCEQQAASHLAGQHPPQAHSCRRVDYYPKTAPNSSSCLLF